MVFSCFCSSGVLVEYIVGDCKVEAAKVAVLVLPALKLGPFK